MGHWIQQEEQREQRK